MGVERCKCGALIRVYGRDTPHVCPLNKPADSSQTGENRESVVLDPERTARAAGRARLALMAARRHEKDAKNERAKAAVLARTWDLDLAAIEAEL